MLLAGNQLYELEHSQVSMINEFALHKGWGNKNEDFQKTEMALEGTLFVLEGCPFQSL